MRLILTILLLLLGILKSPAPIFPNYFTTNANPTIPGGVVSNATGLTFTFATAYTNATPYYALLNIDATLVNASSVQGAIRSYVDFNGDGIVEDSQYYGISSSAGITDRIVLREVIPPYGKFTFTNNSSGGSTASITATTAKMFYFATNGYSGPIASLLNPYSTIATNYSVNRDIIYVRDNSSAQVNGTYYKLWYNPTTLQGVWTNPVGTNIIWQNNPAVISSLESAFTISPATNEIVNVMLSEDQAINNPGVHSYWINPMTAQSAYFNGTANMYFGTNIDSVVVLKTLAVTNNVVLPGYQATNILRVSLLGDDGLSNRTNGLPFKTLWAANNAANWGDLIYVEPGYHTTYGFHTKRGVQIVGSGQSTILNIISDDNPNNATYFQSRLISIWDRSSVGNMVISNGCVGFTQQDGPLLGATNAVAHDLWIYPATNSVYAGEQQSYFNYGVKVSRIGNNNRMERLKIFSGLAGIDFQSGVNTTDATFDIVDCEVICSPQYVGGASNIWLGNNFIGFANGGNVGGMIPLGFSVGDPSVVFNGSKITVNIQGGKYISLNGSTNTPNYIGGENQSSRNAGIWIARGQTNQIKINLFNSPQFIIGSSNAASYFILNEATNNNVQVVGSANVKFVPSSLNDSGTNYVWQGASVGSPFSSTVLGGYYWNSNNALFWVTPTQTRLISDGR